LCKAFGAPRAVLDLMTANIKTHGATPHGWSYKCDGTRKSGDPYTSLMNSIINGLSHLYLYCKWTGRSVGSARRSLKMLVQGDDNLMRHFERQKFPFQEGMAGLGFESEAFYRSDVDQVEFCSSRIYLTNNGYVFGPKPGKVLAKFGYIVNPPANVSQGSMMRGIALGLQRQVNFIPPLKVVVDRVLKLTEGSVAYVPRGFKFTPFDLVEDTMKISKPHESTVDVMFNLETNYYWSNTHQEKFEEQVNNLEFGDSIRGIADLLLDRDTGGPQDIFGSWVKTLEPVAA
jgi:hypothetical protein